MMKPCIIAIGAMADILATNIIDNQDAKMFKIIADAAEHGPRRYRRKLEEIANLTSQEQHTEAASWAAIALLEEANKQSQDTIWDQMGRGLLEARLRAKNAFDALRTPAH